MVLPLFPSIIGAGVRARLSDELNPLEARANFPKADLFHAKWTADIHEEWMRSLLAA
jgi:hypothetical protein